MKTYLIFTPEITNMGGAQMYTANKVSFLKSRGWNVQVFFAKRKGEILISELKEYENNFLPDFGVPHRFMTPFMKRRVFKKIARVCKGTEELVLESQIITTSFLVEEIAEHLGGRHIINTLDERIPITYKNQNEFFKFKLFRWEFQNAGEKRLKQVFGTDYSDSFLTYENKMVYKCSNVLTDVGQEYSFANSDYTILSIGRLDKPYILPMTKEISEFANSHSDKHLNVIYVGGSFSGEYEGLIKRELDNLANVTLYMLGYTYPVPKTIISITDVAIASANSVNVTSDMDVPTIVVDIHDSMAIGVFGYDTNNKFSRTLEPKVPICGLLQRVLIEKQYPKKGIITDEMVDAQDAFERELAFINKSKGNKGYFNMKSLSSSKDRIVSRFIWWKYKIIDPRRLDPR